MLISSDLNFTLVKLYLAEKRSIYITTKIQTLQEKQKIMLVM